MKVKDIYSILLEKIKKISFQKILLKNIHAEEIHSGILLVIYAICLSTGFYLFSSFNFVPTRSLKIRIEELKDYDPISSGQRIPKADIQISIPMKLQQGIIANQGSFYAEIQNYNFKSRRIADTSRTGKSFETSKKILNKQQKDNLDSLTCVFENQSHIDSNVIVKYLDYVQLQQETDERILRHVSNLIDRSTLDHQIATYFSDFKNENLKCENNVFFAVKAFVELPFPVLISQINGVLGTPHWLLLSDLSQAYYKFDIHTDTVNELTLAIDFVGATDFSRMKPEPDNIGMSSISFTDLDKIEQIKKDGLMFHAEFKEMKNKQNVRNFILTSLMALIIGAIVKEILVLSYHLITSARKKRKEDGQN